MGVIYKTDKRRIIPKWRSFKIASSAGELDGSNNINPFLINNTNLLKEQSATFLKSPSIANAGDLLSAAFVLGIEKNYKNAAKYIFEKHPTSSPILFELAKKTLDLEDVINPNFSEINDVYTKYQSQIQQLKFLLKNEPRNSVGWIELGRLYSLSNEIKKADKSIQNALAIDKNNRFIVRSASRYFHHFHKDEELALYTIKKSEFLKNDPWLISAEIAYSTLLGRYSKTTKLGFDILKNYKGNNFMAITELASAIGTIELINGKTKEARKYLNQSLIMPNDNSLAQVGWLSDSLNGVNIEKSNYIDIKFAFEARAHEFYYNKEYDKAYINAVQWQEDEPYSTRPLRLASYIAGTFLNKLDVSIKLADKAHQLNPKDKRIANQLVYNLIQNNQSEKAIEIFDKNFTFADNTEGDISDLTAFTATEGLVFYHRGNPAKGKELYQKAIQLAKRNKNYYQVALATANYIKEEINYVNDPSALNELYQQLNISCKEVNEPDVKIIYDKVIKLYNLKKAKIERL